MIQCEYKINNKCALVHYEIGLDSATIDDTTCSQCLLQRSPKSLNKITSGLCILALQTNDKFNLRKHNYLLNYAGILNMYGVGTEIHYILLILKKLYELLFFQKKLYCGNCESFSQIINSWPIDYCWKYRDIIIEHIRTNCKVLGIPFFKPIYTPIILFAVLKVKFLNEYMPVSTK